MVEMRKGLCFAHESLARTVVLENLRMEHLQRDIAGERRVVRAIDDSHSTGADYVDDAVTSQCLASHWNQAFLAPIDLALLRRFS